MPEGGEGVLMGDWKHGGRVNESLAIRGCRDRAIQLRCKKPGGSTEDSDLNS